MAMFLKAAGAIFGVVGAISCSPLFAQTSDGRANAQDSSSELSIRPGGRGDESRSRLNDEQARRTPIESQQKNLTGRIE